MASAITDRRATPAAESAAPAAPAEIPPSPPGAEPGTRTHPAPGRTPDPAPLPQESGLIADLDHPDLVISLGYVGPERRRTGRLARIRRATQPSRRWLLTLESAVLIVTAAVVATLVLTQTSTDVPAARQTAVQAPADRAGGRGPATGAAPASPVPAAPGSPSAAAPTTTVPAPTPPAATPPATAATTPAPASSAASTPDQLGAEALTLVRYPWQQIPGYTIQFLPIADAPSPGFYGNSTFTWGRTGGTSVLYVYPGETVQRLAGIIAFEIGHEVDAAAVEPAGGEAQIENVLNYHPSSWAPSCDCAEQDYLSGWYAAAFSNYWSPGVGDWSRLPVAPPSGSTLGEVATWLNPAIP